LPLQSGFSGFSGIFLERPFWCASTGCNRF